MLLKRFIAPICVLMAGATSLFAEVKTVDTGFDRWMYPFNASNGVRPNGSTFGAIANPQFDDHDAQVLVGFDTSGGGVASGAGAANYQINSAKVMLTTATDGAFLLDPTYDSYTSYLDAATDTDAGRPIELYGVGFRNGYLSASVSDDVAGPPLFAENDAFGPPGPPVPANANRNAFPSDYAGGTARDVSNNVREAYDPNPWAIANVPSISGGEAVPVDTALEFELDLQNPDTLAYLQAGLDSGELFFSVISLHDSVQGSSEGVPSFHLGSTDGVSLGQTAQLEIDYQMVPEPTAPWMLGLVVGVLSLAMRRRLVR